MGPGAGRAGCSQLPPLVPSGSLFCLKEGLEAGQGPESHPSTPTHDSTEQRCLIQQPQRLLSGNPFTSLPSPLRGSKVPLPLLRGAIPPRTLPLTCDPRKPRVPWACDREKCEVSSVYNPSGWNRLLYIICFLQLDACLPGLYSSKLVNTESFSGICTPFPGPRGYMTPHGGWGAAHTDHPDVPQLCPAAMSTRRPPPRLSSRRGGAQHPCRVR